MPAPLAPNSGLTEIVVVLNPSCLLEGYLHRLLSSQLDDERRDAAMPRRQS